MLILRDHSTVFPSPSRPKRFAPNKTPRSCGLSQGNDRECYFGESVRSHRPTRARGGQETEHSLDAGLRVFDEGRNTSPTSTQMSVITRPEGRDAISVMLGAVSGIATSAGSGFHRSAVQRHHRGR